MTEVLTKFDSGEIIGLVAVVGTFLCGVLGILLGFYVHWQKHRKAETTAALKQDMLNRGMSAEEIQTVLEAGSKSPGKAYRCRRSCQV